MGEEHVAWQGDGTWQEHVLVEAGDLVSLCLCHPPFCTCIGMLPPSSCSAQHDERSISMTHVRYGQEAVPFPVSDDDAAQFQVRGKTAS